LIEARVGVKVAARIPQPNTGSNIEVAKLQTLNREAEKVSEFLTACKLFIRMRMREATVEEKTQWVLSNVQGELADIRKENVLEDLEVRELEYATVGKFLAKLKKKFGKGDNEMMKVAELKKVEQWNKIIEEFVQEFKRVRKGH